MRLAGIAICGVLLVVLAGQAPAARTPAGVAATARAAVVSVSTRPLTPQDFASGPSVPGLGSGVIIDASGLILTNAHVVDGAEGRIKVSLPDDRRFDATLLGADTASDIALLRIHGSKLPALRLGNSDRLTIGEPVIAIGNAMWIEGGPSVTAGIVSALNRSMEQPGLPYLHHLIQTDAAINPGNSGGPLMNLRGEVVGINTALVPSAHGIGFAIAINTAKPIIRELSATGRIVRPWLGLEAVSVTSAIAYANDLSVERGVYVVSVAPGGTADDAGLARGDVIVAVSGRSIKDLHGFEDAVGRQPIGSEVTVVLERGTERLQRRVRIVERPRRQAARRGRNWPRIGSGIGSQDRRRIPLI